MKKLLIALLVLVVGAGLWVYWYISRFTEEMPPAVAATETRRTIDSGPDDDVDDVRTRRRFLENGSIAPSHRNACEIRLPRHVDPLYDVVDLRLKQVFEEDLQRLVGIARYVSQRASV